MKNSADRNLQEINLDQIKSFIKEQDPIAFDKMIISSSEIIKRTNFVFLNYSGEYLNRCSKQVTFPMYGDVKDNFPVFAGGVSKLGEKVIVDSNHIFNTLSSNHQISPEEDFDSNKGELDFKINVNGDLISTNQPLYFLPSRTMSWACETCNSMKYVPCDDNDCEGRHEWDCISCDAKGSVQCNRCDRGRVDCGNCHGDQKITCSNCGGDGKKVDGFDTLSAINSKSRSSRIVKKNCNNCSGKGTIRCSNCNSGKVTCSNCDGNAKVTCGECEGKRTIKCNKCYGDTSRKGMINCPTCNSMGEMAKISFVETSINQKSVSRIFNDDGKLENITGETVLKFAQTNKAQINILRNFNDVFEQNYDDSVKELIENLHIELDFHVKGFENRVTSEELYYQVIPCIQIEYRHMISNTVHNATILNYFDSPELIIEKGVENEKSNTKDKMKGVGNFFGKMFKTNKFKTKEDKKKEIKLMIMIAKIDGKVEDEEKIFLASQVSSLNDFSVAEKSEFFALIDATVVPQISYNDVSFSTPERFKEVIEILESLASKDGNIDESEKRFLEDLNKLYLGGKKK